MFSIQATPEKFENASIIVDFCLTQTRQEKSQDYRVRKGPFSKFFPSELPRKDGVFKCLRLEDRFRKLRFRGGLVWTVGLTVEKSCLFKVLRRSMGGS